ncbi:PiggyBac transposable element-derived protein 4 [Blattella germanica]|nr:PiggyBac transposable element-derived protein 4 [Blattella germanica]
MLSTVDSAGMVEIRDKQGKIKFKPECIVRYNSHMHGVDMADQCIALYPFAREMIK